MSHKLTDKVEKILLQKIGHFESYLLGYRNKVRQNIFEKPKNIDVQNFRAKSEKKSDTNQCKI